MDRRTEIKSEIGYRENRGWFAVRTYINKEQLAKVNFENQGFKVYLPTVKVLRRHARRVEHVEKAFFSGYLFLLLESPEKNWAIISSTRGAIQPVKFGKHYPPVPDRVIEELKSWEDENGLILLDKINKRKFNPGDRVKVNFPELLEYSGIFKASRGDDRALILLDILKRQLEAVVPLSSVSSS